MSKPSISCETNESTGIESMLYLLHGPDEYRRTAALADLCARIPADVYDLNVSVLEGRRLKLDTLVATCEALPFLAERRMVIVNDLLKNQKAGAERDALRSYLERVSQSCDLIFVESEDVDKRGVLFSYLKKHGDVQEFALQEAPELARWLIECAQNRGVRLEPAAAQQMVALVGLETRTLVNELEKLASFVGKGGRITAAIVEHMVQDEQEQNLFAFIDALCSKRRSLALVSVRHLLEDGQAATYILFMIARQLRILLSVKTLIGQRIRPDDIATQLGQKPFVVRKAMEQIRAFSEQELIDFHDRVVSLDHATKTGRIEAETGLELLVAEITSSG